MEPTQLRLRKAIVTSWREGRDADPSLDHEYVRDVARSCDGARLAASLTTCTIKVYGRETLAFETELKGHAQPIVALQCDSTNPQLLYSASEDGAALAWDLRCTPHAPAVIRPPAAEACSMAVGYDGALCAVGGASAVEFYDLRALSSSGSGAQRPKRLGAYEDSHTDAVTVLSFRPGAPSQLLSASEDGLAVLHDTAVAAGAEPVLAVMNVECAVRAAGWFGPGTGGGVWAATGAETLSLWHAPSAQRVADLPAIRADAGVDYLVGCHYDAGRDALALVAGTFGGRVDVLAVRPEGVVLAARGVAGGGGGGGGHGAVVRAFDWLGESLITGGEDARVCSWSGGGGDGAAAAEQPQEAAAAAHGAAARHKTAREGRRAGADPYGRR